MPSPAASLKSTIFRPCMNTCESPAQPTTLVQPLAAGSRVAPSYKEHTHRYIQTHTQPPAQPSHPSRHLLPLCLTAAASHVACSSGSSFQATRYSTPSSDAAPPPPRSRRSDSTRSTCGSTQQAGRQAGKERSAGVDTVGAKAVYITSCSISSAWAWAGTWPDAVIYVVAITPRPSYQQWGWWPMG